MSLSRYIIAVIVSLFFIHTAMIFYYGGNLKRAHEKTLALTLIEKYENFIT